MVVLRLVRPSPELIKARKREIAKRYRRRHKCAATVPQFAAIRITEINRLLADRHGSTIPDDERGRQALAVVAHHLIQLAGHPQPRLLAWASLRAPWLTVASVNRILAEVATAPRRWKADSLGRLLKLTDADRTKLRITTIGAIDCNAWQRRQRRLHKKRLRERQRRRDAKAVIVPTIR